MRRKDMSKRQCFDDYEMDAEYNERDKKQRRQKAKSLSDKRRQSHTPRYS
jgi:hypothetical protein